MIPNEGTGIVELCPAAPDRVAKYFKEVFVSGTFTIPEQKPPKEQVVNINHSVTLEDVETIAVELPPAPIPVAGGNKVFAAGNVYLGVQYSAKEAEQSVHFVRFQLPFQAILLTDCGGLIPPSDTIFTNGYVVHVCVEKLDEKQLDDRTLLIEVLLLVWLEEIRP